LSQSTESHKANPGPQVRRGLRVFYIICGILVLIDPFTRAHAHHGDHKAHPFEWIYGFYGLYGFVACVALVLAATQMRRVLMRDEDYYGPVEEPVPPSEPGQDA
jgi:hypothetical protein